jgi:hypothetical protein
MIIIGFILALALFIFFFEEIDQALSVFVGIFIILFLMGAVGC